MVVAHCGCAPTLNIRLTQLQRSKTSLVTTNTPRTFAKVTRPASSYVQAFDSRCPWFKVGSAGDCKRRMQDATPVLWKLAMSVINIYSRLRSLRSSVIIIAQVVSPIEIDFVSYLQPIGSCHLSSERERVVVESVSVIANPRNVRVCVEIFILGIPEMTYEYIARTHILAAAALV